MKVRMTYQYFCTGTGFAMGIDNRQEGQPASEPKTVVIDTEVNRKYDGAKTLDDVRETFLQGVTQDPMHNVVLQVTGCVEID